LTSRAGADPSPLRPRTGSTGGSLRRRSGWRVGVAAPIAVNPRGGGRRLLGPAAGVRRLRGAAGVAPAGTRPASRGPTGNSEPRCWGCTPRRAVLSARSDSEAEQAVRALWSRMSLIFFSVHIRRRSRPGESGPGGNPIWRLRRSVRLAFAAYTSVLLSSYPVPAAPPFRRFGAMDPRYRAVVGLPSLRRQRSRRLVSALPLGDRLCRLPLWVGALLGTSDLSTLGFCRGRVLSTDVWRSSRYLAIGWSWRSRLHARVYRRGAPRDRLGAAAAPEAGSRSTYRSPADRRQFASPAGEAAHDRDRRVADRDVLDFAALEGGTFAAPVERSPPRAVKAQLAAAPGQRRRRGVLLRWRSSAPAGPPARVSAQAWPAFSPASAGHAVEPKRPRRYGSPLTRYPAMRAGSVRLIIDSTGGEREPD